MIALAALIFEAFYLIAANALFASKALERWIRNDDGTLRLRYRRLWTWVPGRYHVQGMALQSEGTAEQWDLRIEDAHFTCNPLLLLRRRFDVASVRGTGVVYRFRTALTPEQAAREETAAFPPVEGADDPPKPAPESPPTPPSKRWTVAIRGIDVEARELWFQEYRFEGLARTRGAFELTPATRFWVGPAQVDLIEGKVSVGDSTLASSVGGQLTAVIDPVDLASAHGRSVFKSISVEATLDAQIGALRSARTYLPEGARVEDGSGQVRARIAMSKGVFLEDSELSYETDRVRVEVGGVGGLGPLSARWSVGAGGESSELALAVPSATLWREGYKGAEPSVERVEARLAWGRLDATQPWAIRALKASVGAFEAPDVRVFDVEPLRKAGVALEHGAARARGNLAADEWGTVSGDAWLTVQGLTGSYKGDRGHGEVAFFAHVPPSDLAKGIEVSSSRLDLRDVSLDANGKKIEHWWARLDAGQGRLLLAPSPSFTGPLRVHGKDGSPILAYVFDGNKLERELRDHVNTDPLEVQAKVSVKPSDLDLYVDPAQGGKYTVKGRVRAQGGERQCGALLIEREPLSVGVAFENKERDLRPMADQEWLDKKVRERTSSCGRRR